MPGQSVSAIMTLNAFTAVFVGGGGGGKDFISVLKTYRLRYTGADPGFRERGRTHHRQTTEGYGDPPPRIFQF